MPKFLTTHQCTAEVENLLRNSGSTLIFITPYFKLIPEFKERLENRSSTNKETTIIVRLNEISDSELKILRKLPLVTILDNPKVHAKCYTNGTKMVITSLNLYDYSMANNKEMGILLDRNDPADKLAFQEAMDEVDIIIKNSYLDKQPSKNQSPSKSVSITASYPTHLVKKPTGYCIRTGTPIAFDIEKPLSKVGFDQWSKFGNKDFGEKFCHYSGEPSKGQNSFARPVLNKNWEQAVKTHNIRQPHHP